MNPDRWLELERTGEDLSRLRGKPLIPVEIKPLYQSRKGGFEAKKCTECGGPLGFNNKSGHCCHCNFDKNHYSKHYELEPCGWCEKTHIKNSKVQKKHKRLIKTWKNPSSCPYSRAQRKVME